MENAGAGAGGQSADFADTSTSSPEAAAVSDAGGGEMPSHIDAETGSILGDIIGSEDAGGDLADLHAVLASLSNDTFAYLDVALDHLTSSSDLFDVPAMDMGDMPDDFSAG